MSARIGCARAPKERLAFAGPPHQERPDDARAALEDGFGADFERMNQVIGAAHAEFRRR